MVRVPARFLKIAFLKSISVHVDPLAPTAAALMDFSNRVNTKKARSLNSQLEFKAEYLPETVSKPRVEVSFVDGSKQTLSVPKEWQALDIMRELNKHCEKINEETENNHATLWIKQFK